MALSFRNLDVDGSQPVATWPYEALVTAIERGSISDWARISGAIRTDPWGDVARQVDAYLSYEAPVGVAGLMQRAIARARDQREQQERDDVARHIQQYVDTSGLSMTQFAARIGTSRSRLSTYRSGSVLPSAALMTRMQWLAEQETQGESRAHTAS